MVGLKYCSIFNPAYFFQYLLVNFPHRSLSEITPQAGHSLPFQILYFHKAHLLMGNTFINGVTFAATLEVYGHKQYYLPTISSYIQSLIDLNNFYTRQLLPSNSTLPQTSRTSRQASELRGNQLVFYNYFKEIVEYREQCLLSTNNNVDSDVDWKSFPLVLGKPGTGKSFTLQHCIYFCIENNLTICVAKPIGTLACTYKDLYEVTCDTIHGVFLFKCNAKMSSSINSYLSVYDVILIDEISQVSKELFHHVTTLTTLSSRPILVLSGDFCQHQPLATNNNKNVQTENILSCNHCMSYVIRFTLSQQYRIEDDFLLQFLQHIRYDAPTKDMVDKLCRDCILCHTGTVTENVYEHLKKIARFP